MRSVATTPEGGLRSAPPDRHGRWPARAAARWPARAAARWALRGGLSLPFLAVALYSAHRGFASPIHQALRERADQVAAGGPDLAGLRFAYPPLPALIAAVLPGGTLALNLLTALVTGCLCAAVVQRLVLRETHPAVLVSLCAALLLVPAVWYAGSQDLAAVMSLTLLALALAGFVRFAFFAETRGGFVAGLLVAAAFGCGPVALLYALALGCCAPLVAHGRYRSETQAVPATMAVLAFPALAAFAGWAFLEWRFAGTFFHTVRLHPITLLAAARGTGLDLLRSPLYLVVGLQLAARRPIAVLGYFGAVAGVLVMLWSGLDYPPVTGYLLFTLVALFTVPGRAGRRWDVALIAAGAAQVAAAVLWPPSSSAFDQWVHLLP